MTDNNKKNNEKNDKKNKEENKDDEKNKRDFSSQTEKSRRFSKVLERKSERGSDAKTERRSTLEAKLEKKWEKKTGKSIKSSEEKLEKGSEEKDSQKPETAHPKRGRTLRFEEEKKGKSEESFVSAISTEFSEEKYHPEPFSVLKKYIQAPVHRNRPRPALEAPSFDDTEPFSLLSVKNTLCLSSTSSSKQIFELLRNTLAISKADIKLINSTILKNLNGVKEAVGNGANVNVYIDRHTPLLLATSIGAVQIVRYLVTLPSVNINFQNFYGVTSVMISVKNCFDDITLILLNRGADVNITDNMGKTPLHEALFQQRPRMTKLLLAYGADYEKSDIFGERPMYTAAVKKPHLECLKALLNRGASPEYYNISGMTLLIRVILHCTDFSIIEILIENGALVNSPDLNTGKTPLHFSATINDLKITKYLLDHGADVNLKTQYNFTAFDEAIFHNNLEVAELLFEVTANASQRSLKNLQLKKKKIIDYKNL